VESLDPAEQKLIELKYMKRRNDGSRYCDEVVYPQLFIGKTRYYEMKKEALEMLERKSVGMGKFKEGVLAYSQEPHLV